MQDLLFPLPSLFTYLLSHRLSPPPPSLPPLISLHFNFCATERRVVYRRLVELTLGQNASHGAFATDNEEVARGPPTVENEVEHTYIYAHMCELYVARILLLTGGAIHITYHLL